MPILTRDKKVTQQQIIGFECSRCKTIYYDDLHPFEMQEMLHWRNLGGYGSIWGEGNQVEVDLCQRCAHELLEPFATIHAATTAAYLAATEDAARIAEEYYSKHLCDEETCERIAAAIRGIGNEIDYKKTN